MHSRMILSTGLLMIIFMDFFSRNSAIIYSDRHDYDAYGSLLASTDHFIVLPRNDGFLYMVSMAPYGIEYVCTYGYKKLNNFVINVATGRRQNSSQLSFVYLQTNSTDGWYQELGLFTFSRSNVRNSSSTTCSRMLAPNQGERQAKFWYRPPSEMSTLQMDPNGKYAYGFLSNYIFIYDIEKNSVKDLLWNVTFPSVTLSPMALDIGQTSDGMSVAILAGYHLIDIGRSLPIVYLIGLNPPNSMSLIANYTIQSGEQEFVQSRYASSYQFDYVMSVTIHDETQRVIVAVPQLGKTYLFAFTSANLTLISTSSHPARSAVWLDRAGTQVGLVLSGVSTLPWAQSRIEVFNISSAVTSYVYPNNQQDLRPWSNVFPLFLRLTSTIDYQIVILSNDGTVVLVPIAEAGYYISSGDINGPRKNPTPCPMGTYKNIRGTTPCLICPSGTKSSINGSNQINPTINCIACTTGSFCPLGSITDLNISLIPSISQAYAYPSSPTSTSFDDILMQNTFSLTSDPVRCLLISPFFWALITLVIAFVILIIMGCLYYSPSGMRHFDRLTCVFRHSDLIGNGELWFGGLVSFAIVVLIIYGFWFGTIFATKYPIETSTDSEFSCDKSLRNAQFSSLLQLLATIRSEEEKPMFDMLDQQKFTMNITFIQTGFTCPNVTAQEIIGTYSVAYPRQNCTERPDISSVSASYDLFSHQITLQINLTGLYFIGGLYVCLTGPSSRANDSVYIVQEMNYCESFYTSNDTLGQSTHLYFALTKVINRTDLLDYSGSSNFSGIWVPTSTHGSLNDHVMYEQRGDFLRYLPTQQTITISFSETQFYVSNTQQPISRMGEVIFHNILFTTTILGIFALAFLVFKLIFVPIGKCLAKQELFLFKTLKSKSKEMLSNDQTF